MAINSRPSGSKTTAIAGRVKVSAKYDAFISTCSWVTVWTGHSCSHTNASPTPQLCSAWNRTMRQILPLSKNFALKLYSTVISSSSGCYLFIYLFYLFKHLKDKPWNQNSVQRKYTNINSLKKLTTQWCIKHNLNWFTFIPENAAESAAEQGQLSACQGSIWYSRY